MATIVPFEFNFCYARAQVVVGRLRGLAHRGHLRNLRVLLGASKAEENNIRGLPLRADEVVRPAIEPERARATCRAAEEFAFRQRPQREETS